jgi:hypothetical protein
LASPCQIALTCAARRSTGLAREHRAREVDERAVAQVDRVEQPEQQARRAALAGRVLEDALPPDAGLRVLADGPDGIVLGRAAGSRWP